MKKRSPIYTVFKYYEPCWHDWQQYKYCGLNETDKYVVNAHLNSQFEFSAGDTLMFYNRPKVVDSVKNKLETNFESYQDWVIDKFQFALIKLLGAHQVEQVFYCPILFLNINQELKEILMRLRGSNLMEIIGPLPHNELKNKAAFNIILLFIKTVNTQINKAVETGKVYN